MREMQLKLMVGRTTEETAVRLWGRVLFLPHRSHDARALMQTVLRMRPVCIVLPADAPWSWLEFWSGQVAALAAPRLSIRFSERADAR